MVEACLLQIGMLRMGVFLYETWRRWHKTKERVGVIGMLGYCL